MLASALVCHMSAVGAKRFRAEVRRAELRHVEAGAERDPFASRVLAKAAEQLAHADGVLTTQVLRSLVPLASDVVRSLSTAWGADGLEPVITHEDCHRAAVRALVGNPTPYGPQVRMAIAYDLPGKSGTRERVFSGRLSAVHRLMPDAMTRQSWRLAGVMGVEGPGVPRLCRMEMV